MADALARIRARRQARLGGALDNGRSCDGCDVCCTAPGIAELAKPPGQPCQHLAGEPGRSCSIYPSRPKVCSRFHCLWRMTDKVLPDWLRPADCGFMIAFNDIDVWPTVVTVHVDPARPDAWRTVHAQTVFATLAEYWNCIIAIGQSPGTVAIICPDGSAIEITDANRKIFERGDGKVGAPDYTFGPDRWPLSERLSGTLFEWDLPPPAWA